jgi:hypothetical protein
MTEVLRGLDPRLSHHVEAALEATAARDMKRVQVVVGLSCAAAIAVSVPLRAFDAPDGYGAPDPGWYAQGSAPPRAQSQMASGDDGSSWYSKEWYSNQVGGDRRGWQSDQSARDGWYPPPATESGPYDYPQPDSRQGWSDSTQAYPSAPFPDGERAPSWSEPAYERSPYPEPSYQAGSDGRDHGAWGRAEQPRYRFREDPRLESPGVAGGDSGYQFRPLTDKDLERQASSAAPFPPGPPSAPPPAPHDAPRPADRDRSQAFGYEPEQAPGSFYERYYRSGP